MAHHVPPVCAIDIPSWKGSTYYLMLTTWHTMCFPFARLIGRKSKMKGSRISQEPKPKAGEYCTPGQLGTPRHVAMQERRVARNTNAMAPGAGRGRVG